MHHHLSLSHVHGVGTWCFVTRDNVASDPNLTVECLQRTLMATEKVTGELPPVLYLQLDNCWRENKNNVMLNWCASLVERGLFPGGIEIGFLPVGHTHNEVDQIASRISIALRRRDILTPEHLTELLKESYTGLHVVLLNKVADTKEFLNPGLKKGWTQSRFKVHHNLSKFRHFRICKVAKGDVHTSHKETCEGDWSIPYCPIKGQGPDKTKSKGERRLQADAYPKNAVNVHAAKYVMDVKTSLETLRSRMGEEAWLRSTEIFDEVFRDTTPGDFHWENGGVFQTEKLYVRRANGEDVGWAGSKLKGVDEIDFMPALGLFQDPAKVGKHKVSPEPSSLCIGNFIVVLDDVDLDAGTKDLVNGKKPKPCAAGFRMAKILRVNRAAEMMEVVWWVTDKDTKARRSAVWRPWVCSGGSGVVGAGGGRVVASQVVFTFRELRSDGRFRANHYALLVYLLECRREHQLYEENKMQALTILAEKAAIEEDMQVQVGGGVHRRKKRTSVIEHSEKSVSESGADLDLSDDESVVEEEAEDDDSGDESGDESLAMKGDGKDFNLLTCTGWSDCTCTYETKLVPGVDSGMLSAVFNHNWFRLKYGPYRDLTGKQLEKKYQAEWARLEALTVSQGRTRRKT